MKQSKALGHFFAIFTVIVWGSCFVLTKNLLAVGLTPLQITPLRMALAYVTLLLMRPKFMKLNRKEELMFVLCGITGGSLYFFLQNTALSYTYSANASIIVLGLSPIITVILTQLCSKNREKARKNIYFGALIAIVGVVLVVLNGTMTFRLSPKGDLLALGAAASWAVYSILVEKYANKYDNFLVTRRVFFWAFITAVPLMLFSDGMPSAAVLTDMFTTPSVLISWLFLGMFGNAICFAIWNIAFQSLGTVITNNYLYASPFVTVIVGWLLLGEPIFFMSIIGAVLITIGVIFSIKKERKSRSN